MKGKKRFGVLWFLVEVVICVFIFVVIMKVSQYGYQYAKEIANEETQESEEGIPVEISIPEGASTGDIAQLLKEAQLIDHPLLFRLKSKMDGYDGTYKHGTYTILTGTDQETIMEAFQHGAIDADQIKVTIPEGYTAKQIAALLEEKGVMTAAEFLEAANSIDYHYDFIQNLPQRSCVLEGYLFPDTYFFSPGTTGRAAVEKMLQQFDQVLQSVAEESPYSLDEIVTIASIIESEIRVPKEREIASGVIYNRLEKKMKLQMCSTVLYALDKRRDVLLLEDLEIESPYNTYRNDGLPIGPISNPGEAALEAAFHPDQNDYYYFVLKAEADGEHVFTETYEEFLAAKEKYKQQF